LFDLLGIQPRAGEGIADKADCRLHPELGEQPGQLLGKTGQGVELADANGSYLADHEVTLDAGSREYRGFLSLRDYLDFFQPVRPPAEQLRSLGAWIGEQVFGGLKDALLREHERPATAVRVRIPREAEPLLLRPFELARQEGADGPALTEFGVRLVYQLADTPDGSRAKAKPEQALRVLAVFSLPDQANPLNLRRERYQLQRLVRDLGQRRGKAVELRTVQYGATRQSLRDLLEEAPGWDMVQLSGHGEQGELLIETEAGGIDRIQAGDLAALLRPSRARLKLLVLDACYSGAASPCPRRCTCPSKRPWRATPAHCPRGRHPHPVRPPDLPLGEIMLPRTGLIYFPPEPPRFVGRLGPLLRGSLALAPASAQRGVLFYGMAGAGKSACALEPSYRHERDRFRGQVWYKAPEAGSDIGTWPPVATWRARSLPMRRPARQLVGPMAAGAGPSTAPSSPSPAAATRARPARARPSSSPPCTAGPRTWPRGSRPSPGCCCSSSPAWSPRTAPRPSSRPTGRTSSSGSRTASILLPRQMRFVPHRILRTGRG
jgi:hypothetical protein